MYDIDHPKEVSDEEIVRSINENEDKRPVNMKSKSGIVVKGIHDLAVRFSKCCAPVPGDEILGFVTRGRGISIHRTDCINILSLPETERNRIIEAEWEESVENEGGEKYIAEVQIVAYNRKGMLVDITKAISEKEIDIISLNSRMTKKDIGTITVSFGVENKEELRKVLEKLGAIEGVISAERTIG